MILWLILSSWLSKLKFLIKGIDRGILTPESRTLIVNLEPSFILEVTSMFPCKCSQIFFVI